jgi:hypothetical protein
VHIAAMDCTVLITTTTAMVDAANKMVD